MGPVRSQSYKYFCGGLLIGAWVSAAVVILISLIVSSAPLAGIRSWGVATAAAALLAVDILDRSHLLPQARRQLPQGLTFYEGGERALRVGLAMGTGARTFSPSSLPLSMVVALVFVSSADADEVILRTAIAATGFALGRMLMPLARGRTGSATAWDESLLRDRRLAAVILHAMAATLVIAAALRGG